MFKLASTTLRRDLPEIVLGLYDLNAHVIRRNGESLGANKGGKELVILSPDNVTLALYTEAE